MRALWEGEIRNIETNEILVKPAEYLNDEKRVRVGFRTVELIEEPMGMISLYLSIYSTIRKSAFASRWWIIFLSARQSRADVYEGY